MCSRKPSDQLNLTVDSNAGTCSNAENANLSYTYNAGGYCTNDDNKPVGIWNKTLAKKEGVEYMLPSDQYFL